MGGFARIPAGWFRMGSDDGQPDEAPAHRVWVDAFELAVDPVTRREYAAFLAATGREAPREWDSPALAGPERPAVGVSWNDAVVYCLWRSSVAGDPVRLPTEAEWERAARGGRDGDAYPGGDGLPAWLPNGGRGPLDGPWPVALGPANPYGVRGIAANIHEWCADWHGRDFYRRSPARNPAGPATGRRRVSKGGSWRHALTMSRVAARSKLDPSFRYTDYGFRVARDIGTDRGLVIPDSFFDPLPEDLLDAFEGGGSLGRRPLAPGLAGDSLAPGPPMSDELDLARRVALAVRDAGGRALIVGGWVRDRLRGAPSRDIDLEVHGLDADRLRAVLAGLGAVNAVGASFAVFKLGPLDIALPRTESKTGRGHRGFRVTGDPHLPLAEAARRRDFTVNAVAWDPLRDQYLDPHGGRADVERRRLRMVDPATFGDDSLRVLRAAQLAARLEFDIEEATRARCRTVPLDDLPAERVWGEVEKLLEAARPSIGLRAARELGVVDRLFPELRALVGCPQEPEWHPEGDVWVHTLLVVDEARRRIDDLPYPQRVAVMLGAVCHDFGKPATTAYVDGRIRSLNHEALGVEPAATFLGRLGVRTLDGYDVRGQVLGLVGHHLKPGMWRTARDGVGDGAFRRLARKVDLELLARLAKADCLGRTGDFDCSAMDWFLERARSLGVEHAPPAPILLGRHVLALGLPPGPRVGAVLRQVYERQLDGEVTTLDEGKAIARALLAESR